MRNIKIINNGDFINNVGCSGHGLL